MSKIGIDARLYSQTGVGVYLRNLLYFLEKNTKNKIIFHVYLLPEDYNKLKFKNKNFAKKITNSRWHTFSEQINFVQELYKDNLNLMHFTYFSYPVLYKRKFIATIHDTTPLLFKTGKASTRNPLFYELKFQAFKFVIAQQVKNATCIITPSKTVKKQLIELFGNKYENKIVPIYEGVDYELTKIRNSKFEIRNFNNKSFFIYIGNFYPHKNVENLIKAFSKVQTEAKLILIGPDDFFAKRLIQLIKQLNQTARIDFYFNPSKLDLIFFYKNALALIQPSLSEGFGLPLVEAAYFSLPIVASNIEVFREILEDKYIRFNPESTSDIAKKIRLFLDRKKKFDYSQIKNNFSFEDMARQTLRLYQKILT